MVEQVTLQGPEAASSGNPSFLGSFSRSIGALSSAIGSASSSSGSTEESPAVVAVFNKSAELAEQQALKGGDLEQRRLELLSFTSKTTSSSALGKGDLSKISSILQNFGSNTGLAGSFATAQLEDKKALEEAAAKRRAENIVNLAPHLIGASAEQQDAALSSIENKQSDTASNELELNNLNSQTNLESGVIAAAQRESFRGRIYNDAVLLHGSVRSIVGNVTFDSTEEEKNKVRQSLLDLKANTLAKIGSSYGEILQDIKPQVDNFTNVIDLTISGLSNEEASRSISAANNISSEAAVKNLIFNNPEALKLHTLLTTIGAYSDSYNFEEGSAFGVGVNKLLKMFNFIPPIPEDDSSRGTLETGISNQGIPKANIESEIISATKDFTTVINHPDVIQAASKDPRIAEQLAALANVVTNKMAIAPDKVPAEAYDAVFKLTAVEGGLEAVLGTEGGEKLLKNLESGIRSYTSTLTDRLYSELNTEVTNEVGIVDPVKRSSPYRTIKIPGSDIELRTVANDRILPSESAGTTRFPLVRDLIEVKISETGNLEFSPRPGVGDNREVTALSARLTKKYTNRFGLVTRSHAHTNNNNSNYKVASHEIVTSDRRLSELFVDKPAALEEKVLPTGGDLTKEEVDAVTIEPNIVLDTEKLKKLMDEGGNREEILKMLIESGIDAEAAKAISGMRIPELGKADEGSIIQLEDGTIAVVKKGKLVEPTSEDLQLG